MRLASYLLLVLTLTACSPRPTAKEIALQKRIDALEARIHTLELDRSLSPGSSYSRFPNLRQEAQAEGKLAAQKAQYDTLKSLPQNQQTITLIALGLAGQQLQAMQESIKMTDLEIAARKTELQPAHPHMVELQARRDQMTKLLELETGNTMRRLKAQLEVDTNWVAAMKKPSVVSP